jgi:hypothetical protein
LRLLPPRAPELALIVLWDSGAIALQGIILRQILVVTYVRATLQKENMIPLAQPILLMLFSQLRITKAVRRALLENTAVVFLVTNSSWILLVYLAIQVSAALLLEIITMLRWLVLQRMLLAIVCPLPVLLVLSVRQAATVRA